MSLPTPFPKASQEFLNAFYAGHNATTTIDKITAIRTYFIREPMTVTVDTDEAELLALEYYILDQLGMPQ